jgi:hypothetical protein
MLSFFGRLAKKLRVKSGGRSAYGLSDGYTYTIDEIGEQFGIKPERVAEIGQRSIDKK